jgi:prepilin-type N-terminal cleavage/methylation domain-containing protein
LPEGKGRPVFYFLGRMGTMKKTGGFSLIELLIVLAVIAVVSAIVTPNIISWRSSAKLRGAAGNLKGDLEMAKVNAIKENNFVAIKFEGNADEQLLRTRTLPAGVVFDFSHPNWTFTSHVAKFNGRGTADNGTAILTNTKGDEKKIRVETLGRIRILK